MHRALLGLLVTVAGAQAACTDTSPDVAAFLKREPGWRIVQVSDLARDDQELWRKHSAASCPGLVRADFDGSGKKFTVLNLLNPQKRMQKTVALRGAEVTILRKAHAVANPTVLAVEAPGSAKEWDSERRVELAHESISIVQMEASAEQFYFANGKFQSIWTSD